MFGALSYTCIVLMMCAQLGSCENQIQDSTDNSTEVLQETLNVISKKIDAINACLPKICHDQNSPIVATETRNYSCLSIYNAGDRQDEFYFIHPYGMSKPVEVFCDMTTDGGGWTVVQRRLASSTAFNSGWNSYKNGFESITDVWLGNEIISHLTQHGPNTLRIDIKHRHFSAPSTAYAKYENFHVETEVNNYKLTIGAFSGTLSDVMKYQNHAKFSTYDRDNDLDTGVNIAKSWSTGWWFNSNRTCDLNSPWSDLIWDQISGQDIESTEMKLR